MVERTARGPSFRFRCSDLDFDEFANSVQGEPEGFPHNERKARHLENVALLALLVASEGLLFSLPLPNFFSSACRFIERGAELRPRYVEGPQPTLDGVERDIPFAALG
jgi:hypothetical protein